jgi:hypothetical protein
MWKATDQSVLWLWEVLEELAPEDRSYFIQHWTGTPKIPAEGLKAMELSIMKKSKGDTRIFGQTCFNRIMLPVFEKKEDLKESVMMAVNSVKAGLSIL